MARYLPILCLLVPLLAVAGDAPAPTPPAERKALEAVAARDYHAGVQALRALVEREPASERTPFREMVLVRALSLAGRHADAAEAGAAVLAARPDGPFSNAVRFLVADAFVALGREREAAEKALAGLDALESETSRARIADLYLAAARTAFTGSATGEGPFRREGKPDYVRALKLYRGAREIGVAAADREEVAERIVRCLLETKAFHDAAREAETAIGEAKDAARPRLLALHALALARAGSSAAARRAVRRLLDAHPGHSSAAEPLLALGDLASLLRVRDELGDCALASEAAWRAATLLEKQGDAPRASAAYRTYLDRYPSEDKAAEADFRIAEILLATGEWDAAARAFTTHRERHPLSLYWTNARQRAIDAGYGKGEALRETGKLAEAFECWERFANAHPDDARVPGILLAEGDWHRDKGRAEDAYARWNRLRTRYRSSPLAAAAALRIARLFEETVGDLDRAVAEYRAVVQDFPKAREAKEASRRLSVLRSEALAVRLPRAFRPGETPHLEVVSRNVPSVTVRIHEVDLADYFRRRRTVANLDEVLVDVIRPAAVLERDVPDHRQYRETSWKLEITREGPGAAIVVVEGGGLRSVTLLLVSELTLITKEWESGALAFVQDVRTGEPVEGVEVLASGAEGKLRTARTAADGVARIEGGGSPYRILAVRGASVASDEFDAMPRETRDAEILVHVWTDRPLYRPGHEVAYRAIVRERTGDALRNLAGHETVVRVRDGAGNDLHLRRAKLSAHGTVHGAFRLPPDLPPGDYRVEVLLTGRSGDFAWPFRVEEYTKPDLLLSIEPEHEVVLRGETVRATVRAKYAFGKPAPGLRLTFHAGNRSLGTIVTDAAGEAVVEVPTTEAGRLELLLAGRDVARRFIQVRSQVIVADRGFEAVLTPDPATLPAGEEVRVRVATNDPLGAPVARSGRLRVLRAAPGTVLFAPVLDPIEAATKDDGLTTVRLRLEKAGLYRLRWEGIDRRGAEVSAQTEVRVEEAEALRRISVRAERETYAEGETARIAVRPPGVAHALVTLEGERVYGHRVVRMPAGAAQVDLALGADCVPDVRIRVALAHRGELWTGGDRVLVRRRLNVEIRPESDRYRPGDLAVVHVRTTDARGEPVSAELAMAVVDEALYALREDRTPAVGSFFSPPERADLVRTGASLDFAYDGVTTRLSEDLLAERERRKSPAREAVMLEDDLFSDAPFDGPSTNASIGIGGGAGGSMGGRRARKGLRAEGGGSMPGRLAELRKDFADTAHWAGALVTGPDGKGRVSFPVPDNLTTWRITARAATVGAAFGDGRGSFACAKDLVVLISAPPVLRDGDEVLAAASVHNAAGEPLDAVVSLDAGEALYGPFAGAGRRLAVGADSSFDWPIETPRHGTGLLTAGVRAGNRSDAEQRTVRVLPFGVPVRKGSAGTLDAPVDWRFVLPEDAVPGTAAVELRLAPSVTAQVVSALDRLDAFPYGCVEQTVNRFYPAVAASRALRKLGRDEPALLRRLDETVRAGVRRLSYLQQSGGAWGWWGRGRPDPVMSAYATRALAAAARRRRADVPERVLDGAVKGLGGMLRTERDLDRRALLALARLEAGSNDASFLTDLYAARSRLGVRGQAWLTLAFAQTGAVPQMKTLAGEIARRIEVTRDGARFRPATRGVGVGLEGLALALHALVAADHDRELAARLALTLAAQRRDGAFGSTIETGAAVLALSDYLVRRGGAADAGFRVEAIVNDADPVVVEMTPESTGRERVVRLPSAALRPGENRIRLRRAGAGAGGYSLSASWVGRSGLALDAVRPRGALARRYALGVDSLREEVSSGGSILRPGGERREPDVSRVEVGDLIRVTLDLTVRPGLRFLQVEDPVPAGFVVVDGTVTGPADETVVREDRIVFFVADPTETLRIEYLMRAAFPGTVRVPPARAFPMYTPDLVSTSRGRKVTVGLPGRVERPLAAGLSPAAIFARAKRVETSDPAMAARLVDTLLEQFDVKDEWALRALEIRARSMERLDRPAEVVETYVRMRAIRPGLSLSLEAATRLARAALAANRPGDVLAATRRAVTLRYDLDRKVLADLAGRIDESTVALELAGRYPFGPRVEEDLSRLAGAAAGLHDEMVAEDGQGEEERLDGLLLTRALYPDSPGAAELLVRRARSRLRAGEWKVLERTALLCAELYPDHPVRAEADWFHAYALFAQERYEAAAAAARASLGRKTYRLKNGASGASPYEQNLTHLLAQTYHVLGDLDRALTAYRSLTRVSPDAAAVVRELTETRLVVPGRLRVPVGERPVLKLDTRNVEAVRLRVYPIDLLTYFAIRKDLDRLRAINLDGLAPAIETEAKVEGWRDRRVHETGVPLDLEGPGVYLVLAQAGELRASGVLLISDLTLEVRTDRAGRVRVLARNVRTGKAVKGAHVKVALGSRIVGSGVTDARGVYDSWLTGRRRDGPPVDVPVETESEPIEREILDTPGVPPRPAVVGEKDGHAAAWW